MRRRTGLFFLLCLAGLAPLVSIAPGAGQTIPVAPGNYLPIILRQEPPTPTVTPTPTATNTPRPTATTMPASTPTATPTLQLRFICDHDAYNCSDFNTQAAAQTVYNYCVNLGFGDIHRLDGNNNNGLACESLP